MAKPVIAWRASVFQTSPAATVYTASPTWTPAANSLIFAFVVGSAASPADPTGVTAHGVTLTKLTLSQNSLSTVHFISMWVGNAGASPTSAAAEGTWASNQTGGSIVEFEITGWESSEPVQNAFGRDSRIDTATAATGTTGTVNINLRPDVTGEHVLISCWLHLANEVTTPRTNWTETAGADGNFTSPAQGVEVQFRTDAFELTATATWSTSIDWRGYALVVRGTATTPKEVPKLSDTVTARLNPDPISLGDENLKIADTVTVDLPLQPGLLSETSKARDVIFGATRSVASQNALSAGLEENPLKVQDGAPSGEIQINLAPPALTENLKLADGGVATQRGIVQLLGVVHVQDQLTPPVMDAPPSGDLGPPTIGVEALKLADSITVLENPLQTPVADEVLHVVDTVTVLENPLQTSTPAESLKIQDSVSAFENPLFAAPSVDSLKVDDQLTPPVLVGGVLGPPTIAVEAIKVADTVTVFENPLFAAPALEPVKLQDTVTPDLPLQPGLLLEGLRLSDQPPFIEERLRITDSVIAAIPGADLGPPTIPVESVKVQDTVTCFENPLLPALADEVLHCVDTLTPPVLVSAGDLTPPLLTETLTLADGGAAAQRGIVQLLGVVHVVDQLTPPVLVGGGILGPPTIAVESLKVADTVTAISTPLLPSTGALTETLYLDDIGLVVAIGIDEILHVVDILTPPVLVSGGNLGPPTIAVESVKVQDTLTVVENPLIAAPPVESLKVQDQLTPPSMGNLGPPTIAVEALSIVDTVTVSENPLFAAPVVESLKVQDSLTPPSLGDLGPPTIAVESFKIADTVTVSENPLFAAPPVEALIVQDSVTVSENPLFGAPAVESLKVQDQLTPPSLGNLGPPTIAVEGLSIVDTVTVVENPLFAAPAVEALIVQDSVALFENPLFAAPGLEPVKVQDTVTPALELSTSTPSEALKVSDAVTPALSLSATPAGENIKISDTVTASLTVLRVAVTSEALKLAETVSPGVDLLTVVVTPEVLHVQDFWVVLAVPDVTVRVRPVVGIIHVRKDTGSVQV